MASESRPGHLLYLCIYNPSLGLHNDTLADQVLFYYSQDGQEGTLNDQMRQIGLAQGIVEFSRGFANGEPMSFLETKQTRIVVDKLEEDDYWVVACTKLTEITLSSDGSIIHTSAEMASPEVIIADLRNAYGRWRLKYGSFSDNLTNLKRQGLVDLLSPWWQAWCNSWQIFFNTSGVFRCTDKLGLRVPRGGLTITPETQRAIENIVDMENVTIGNKLADMLIFQYDTPSNINDVVDHGCVYTGRGVFKSRSIIDLFSWITDCHDCDDDSAYLEPSGFVLHINNRTKQKQTTEDSVDTTTRTTSDYFASTTALLRKNATELGNKSVESVGTMVDYMNPFNYLPKSPITASLSTSLSRSANKPITEVVDPQTGFPQDELQESRFLIGLQGDLEDGNDDGGDGDELRGSIVDTTVFLQPFESGVFNCYNVVIYQRRPFVFALIYSPTEGEPYLTDPAYYLALHRRLAALADPILHDLNMVNAINPYHSSIFHSESVSTYTVILERGNMARYFSNLPYIPNFDDPPLSSSTLGYIEAIHLHQHLAMLLLSNTWPPTYQEKLIRTVRNWWIYVTQVVVNNNKDNNQSDLWVVIIKKWKKPATKLLAGPDNRDQSADMSLVGAFGIEVHNWLERFKQSGRF